jgi:hypothetical protein
MKRILAVACLLGLFVASAQATNIWVDNGNQGSVPPTDLVMPVEMPGIGDPFWFYIYGRPDEGKTLQNLSLNVGSSNGDAIWFTDVLLDNPILGQVTFPPPTKNILRYEFVQDTSNGIEVPSMQVDGVQGFSVTNAEAIGAGIGPGSTDFDPGYFPGEGGEHDDSWLLGVIHGTVHRPGHFEILLAIGENGLNNTGESSSDTMVLFGPSQEGLNGESGRGVFVPVAKVWVVPEPSSVVIGLIGALALVPLARRRG